MVKYYLTSGFLFGVLVLLPFGIVPSAPTVNSRVEIKNRSRDLDKVQEELHRKKQENEQLLREANELKRTMQDHQSKMKGIETTLLYTKRRNMDVETDMARSKNKRDRVSKQISDTSEAVRQTFGTHYVMASVVGPSAPATVYTQQLYRSNIQKLDRMKDSKEAEDRSYQDLTSTYQLLQKEVQSQESNLNRIQSGLQTQERSLQKKLTRREILEDELKELQQTAEELASLIDVLRSKARQEEVSEKRARLEKITTGHSPIPRGSLPWPASGSIIKKFGRQKHAELSTLYISDGIVIRTEPSAAARCVSDGHVLYAGNFMSYGKMVVVEHPGDWFSVYGRLANWTVEKGQILKRGESVGVSGFDNNNRSEVYFELRFYGKPVDPLPWLRIE